MALTVPPTAPLRTMAQAEFDAAVAARIAWDAVNVTELTALQTDVAAKQGAASAAAATATAQAGIATTQAGTATTQAGISTTQAGTATTQAGIATTQAGIAVAAFVAFGARNLGAKASDPVLDNDGNALIEGAQYFSTTIDREKYYDGTAWKVSFGDAIDVTYTPLGTGAVATTAQAKLRERVSVADKGADATGIADCLTAFNDAASEATTVVVPKGTWKLSAATTGSAMWYIEAGAYISGLPDINPGLGGGVMNDTSRLTGKVFHLANIPGYTGIRLGDSDPWLEKSVRSYTESISEVSVLSSSGQIGLVTATRTSDNPTANYAGIGHASYAINDNASNPEPAWSEYREYHRSSGAGATYNSEMDAVNAGDTFDLDPYSTINATSTQTVHSWLTNGGGDVALGGNEVSAAAATHANPQKFRRGFVFMLGSLNSALNEMTAGYMNARHAWYDAAGSLLSYISGRVLSLKSKSDTASTGISYVSYRRKADGVTATANLDVVHRHDFFGYSGAADYSAAWHQIQQRANFSGGNARFSYDIGARNEGDGTESQISLNGLANKSYAPYPDNSITLGNASFRWSTVYAVTGTINTSDANQKQDILPIDAELVEAFLAIDPTCYRWKSAVMEKGDAARIHLGFIAQSLQSALQAQGIDPARYAIWCQDDINEVVLDADGKPTTEVRATGTKRQGLRYDQFIALTEAANRKRFSAIEQRLAVLEAAR